MIPTTVAEAARRFGDRIAYVSEHGWSLSYADLDRISDEVAVGLAREGVGEGDVVALVLPPGPEYLLAYCAAAKLGAITAGVNDRLSAPERTAVLELARPKLVLAAPRPASAPTAPRDRGLRAATSPRCSARCACRRAPPPLARRSRSPGRDHLHVGHDRAAQGRASTATASSRSSRRPTPAARGTRGGRSFSGTSFAHLGFMTKLPGSLRRGGTTFIMERWRAADALELLAREKMTTVAGVPTQLALMLRHPDFDAFDLVERAVHHRRRRAGHARARRGGAPPLRRAARDALLVHRSGHRARHRVRRSRRRRGRERRPPARERRARGCSTATTGRSPRARSARCACARPR